MKQLFGSDVKTRALEAALSVAGSAKLFQGRSAKIGAVVALAAALAVTPAKASSITFTASGTGSNGALDAEADFITSSGQISVTITNLLSAATIVSIGQSVSDLSFTLSNAPGTPGTYGASGQLATLGAGGAVSLVSGAPTRWIDSSIGGGVTIAGNTVTLEAIGHGSPDQLIMPADDAGFYPAANSSVFAHIPIVDGSATFTLPFGDVTSDTTITSVQFSFGTGPDTFITQTTPGGGGGGTVTEPEPASMLLLGAGLAGLGIFRRRRRS